MDVNVIVSCALSLFFLGVGFFLGRELKRIDYEQKEIEKQINEAIKSWQNARYGKHAGQIINANHSFGKYGKNG